MGININTTFSHINKPKFGSPNIPYEYKNKNSIIVTTVLDVVLTGNKLGFISTTYGEAFPFNANIKQYPLKGEKVILIDAYVYEMSNNNPIIDIPKYFYIGILGVWGNNHCNILPLTDEVNPGQTFTEREIIQSLLPFEGDIIYEGRWGNSIRFGSTVKDKQTNIPANNDWSDDDNSKNGDPVIILRNNNNKIEDEKWVHITEDINKDDSSIYLTSTQQIKLEPSSLNYVSYSGSSYVEPILPSSYAASQIILNSGRLVFNSKNDHILLNSAKSINLNSLESINIDTKELSISADTISLGPKYLATEPLLLGNTTVTFLKNLIKAINDLAVELKDIKTEPAYMGPNILPQSLSVPGVRLKATSLITALDLLNVQLTNLDLTSKRNFTV